MHVGRARATFQRWFRCGRKRRRTAPPPAPLAAIRHAADIEAQAAAVGAPPTRRIRRRLCEDCLESDSTPKHAVEHEHLDCLEQWVAGLQDKTHINRHIGKWTLVHWAARRNKPTSLRWLVGQGANVDILSQSNTPHTPLHQAAARGHVACLDVLLDLGASQTIVDAYGWTPIHWAAQHGHREAMWRLLARGGDPDTQDDDGLTPLHAACIMKNEACATLLLDVGVRIEVTGDEGDTFLLLSVESDMYNVAARLLERGANPEHSNHEGKTALFYAKNDAMRTLLRESIRAHRRARTVRRVELCTPLCHDTAGVVASFVE